MASERATFQATLDLREVEAGLGRARKAIADALAGPTQRALSQLDGASGKAAKAIGALDFAMGGLGRSSVGVLKDVGDVAMILGSGGVLGIALAAGTFAIGKLYAESIEAEKRLASLKRTLSDDVAKALDAVAKRAEDAQAKLTNLGLTPQTIARNQAETALGSAIAQEKNAQEALLAWTERRNQLFAQRTSIDHDEFMARAEQLKADNAVIHSLLDKARGSIPFLQAQLDVERKLLKTEEEEAQKRFANVLKPATGGGVAHGGGSPEGKSELRDAYELFDILQEIEQDKIKKKQAAADAEAEIAKKLADEERAQAERVAQFQDTLRMEAIAKDEAVLQRVRDLYEATYSDTVAGAFTGALSAAQGYFDGLITGEENAAKKALAGYMKSTGGQLVSVGTRALFEGLIANAAIPGSGLGLMATGGAAIAAGIAMGAGGTAMAHTAAGGTIGQPLPDKAKTDRGAPIERRTGGGGSRGGGGGVTIVNQWGVAGPSADDQARAMSRVIDRVRDGRF